MSTPSPTMEAWVIRAFGDADVFERALVDRPTVEPNHVLVRVEATSVNPIDTKVRSGAVGDVAPEFPAVLHGDIAGTVETAGEGVDGFSEDDEVYACYGGVRGLGGALGEYVLVDSVALAHKPDSLSMREAAALPLVAITAWDGLLDRAAITPGDSVLVHGATGGVGHVAVQLAAQQGAVVHATASTKPKRETARALGADYAFDYDQPVEDYVREYTDGDGFDVVFDSVGAARDNLGASVEAAGSEGHVVTTVTRGDIEGGPMHAKGLTFDAVFMLIPLLDGNRRSLAHHGEILDRVATLVDERKLGPLLDTEQFGFGEAAAAHRRLESGEHVGKVTLARE